jgi:hypothetical protein
MSRSNTHYVPIGLAIVIASITLTPAALAAKSISRGPVPDVFERAVARHLAETVRPDDRVGPLGVGVARQSVSVSSLAATPDVFERAVVRHLAATSRPDDRAGPLGIGWAKPLPSNTSSRPDDRAGLRGVDGATRIAAGEKRATLAETSTSSGTPFHWQDAAIGAASALALFLLLLVGVLAQRQRRSAIAH